MDKSKDFVLRLIVIDDEVMNLDLIREALSDQPIEVIITRDPHEGLGLVESMHPHLVFLDLTRPFGALELLEKIVDMDPGIDVILMTENYTPESAVEAIQKGAYDYLRKPLSISILREKMGRMVEAARQRQHMMLLETELLEAFQLEGMVGRSPAMLDLFRKVRLAAPHYRTVLLLGETGTGKELLARALHRLSPVASGPFVAFNCSALVETLFESELFGHVKGAFTGATHDKTGIFEYANNGTLMLDEIGDLPLNVQAKLLRILQTQEVQRVGSSGTRKINVRVIGATHRDLMEMVEQKTFREDLYHRLSMMEITLPPLSERKEDFILLQRHFLRVFSTQYEKQIRGLTRRAQSLLGRYHWPGNVRELENVLGHGCMMAQGEVIDIRDLPERLREQRFTPELPGRDRIVPLDEYVRRYVRRVVDHTRNKSRAAEILGLSRATLYRMLQEKSGGDPAESQDSNAIPFLSQPVGSRAKGSEKNLVVRRDF